MELPALLQSIYDATPDAITYIDSDGRIVLFNRAAELLTGYSTDEIRHIPMIDLYPNADDFSRITKLVESDGRCLGIETTIRNRSGELIPISLSVAVVKGPDGIVNGTVGISRDLRAIRHLQNQLEHLEHAAVRMAIASKTAHEINNPLEIIENYLYLMETHTSDVAVTERISIIRQELARIAQIVRSLTGMTTEIEIPHKPIDIRSFILQFRDLIIPWTVSHGIDLAILLPESLPTIHSSIDHIKQIFLNLTLFAIRSMPNGGRFEIEADSTVNDLALYFRDSSDKSIDEQELFRRFSKTPDGQQEIGIPICYGLVGSLGGSMTVRANPTGGTEFLIRIPLDTAR